MLHDERNTLPPVHLIRRLVLMKKFFSLVLALAMALSMASFASAEETTTIHIGVIGPMTGAAALNGQYMTNATTMPTASCTALRK